MIEKIKIYIQSSHSILEFSRRTPFEQQKHIDFSSDPLINHIHYTEFVLLDLYFFRK